MILQMNGVPKGVAQDGWWLDDAPPVKTRRAPRGPVAMLVALVLLGDVLFWGQAGPGLSLVLFMAVVALAAARPRAGLPYAVLALSLLPLFERVQALSLGFALAGVLAHVLLPTLNGGPLPEALATAARRFVLRMPGVALGDLRQALAAARGTAGQGRAARIARHLALPLGLGLVFASLLAQANPLLQDGLRRLLNLGADPVELVMRALFWAGLALMLWPLLVVGTRAAHILAAPAPWQGPLRPRRNLGLVTAASVTSSLILFNAMFSLQTLMDAAFLWAAAALPQGMTHAAYAHRGAYPLVITALLAGGFALISRPFAAEARGLRLLLILWVAQNVALVGSALYRLDLYVQAYGLTYLRAHAAVWMLLVALGLMLVLAQVARGLPNRWLVLRATALGAGMLYTCTFINFAGLIADYNLTAAQEGNLSQGLDAGYLCALGPDAWAARAKAQAAGYTLTCPYLDDGWDSYWLDLTPPEIEGWRDWSLRSWRVLRAGQAARKGAAVAYPDRG